jgi:peptidoglycan hydrolase-like protein with peptidoglycan-binding domain
MQLQSKTKLTPLIPAPLQSGLLQRKCDCGNHTLGGGTCDECGKKKMSLQRATQKSEPETRNSDVPPIVHDVLLSSGQPLDARARTFFEPRFAHDFSRVRVHADAKSAESARAVNARAYTVGENVVFGTGQFMPTSHIGQRLLAHELAHVVQQSNSQTACQYSSLAISKPDDAGEREADQIADAVMGSSATSTRQTDNGKSGRSGMLQRTIGDGHDLQSARFAGDEVLEACFDGERTLRVGSRGEAVQKIQQALIDAGFPLPKFGADGDFGAETQTSLQNFQRENGLEADGIVGPNTMGSLDTIIGPAPVPPGPEGRELTAEELAAIEVVAQTTPDGNALGPTDPTHRGCLGNRFFFRQAGTVNTTTAAQGISAVTATLGQPPADAADCSCGCGLFRQFIRGFWRAGTPTSAKQFNIGSCGNTITMNETTFTEEFVNCITGGLPIGPGCSRVQADAPGATAGLTEGTFFQMHLALRYQMWDQCRGRSLGLADHVLDISGSNSPRTIRFT